MMKVPLLDLQAQYAAIRWETRQAIDRVCDSQKFILGPEVGALEQEIANFCGAAYAVGVSSGTDALLIALMAGDVGPGDEVITSPFTFFATAGVIARLGAKPVFVDIQENSFNLDPAEIEASITKRTKAILPVHLFGRCADMPRLLEVARSKNLLVIEDAAQAIGAHDESGTRAGTFGHAGCFSFFPSKNLGAFGDGGMVVTNDKDMASKLSILRVHGGEPKYHHAIIGGNFRLDALQAAVLRVKLKYLSLWTQARKLNAARYRNLFAQAGLLERTTLPEDVPGHIYNQFVVRCLDRDALKAFLRRQGVETEIYYPIPLHLQKCFEQLGYKEGDLPRAETAALQALALPIYPELTEEQQIYVVDQVAEFYGSKPSRLDPQFAVLQAS
ncbi:MAG TPA: DegT/DnrJ/EryC1/StrS family aminotransferase [Candidatus Binatia bacterium]|jgi:dTDP-4-amino-4,6-dideoxygalactose transaminase